MENCLRIVMLVLEELQVRTPYLVEGKLFPKCYILSFCSLCPTLGQVSCVIWMMPASAILATRGRCVTPIP
jgi:hypothetical protein